MDPLDLTAIVVIAGCMLAPGAVFGQAPGPGPQGGPPDLRTELVFEREVFEYPSFPRQNPFVALDAAGTGGPRFEQLSLIGIMHSDDPTASVAVISTGGVAVAADGTISAVAGDAYYLKTGQRLGNVTIVEIQPERVIVDVEEFGLTDRRTFEFQARRQGGNR